MVTDPRYDAQFRRGYEGPPVPPPAARAQTPPAPSARTPVAPVEGPIPSPLPVDEPVGVVGTVVTDQDPPPLRRRNPWSIALLVGGLALLIAGGWLLRSYATTNATTGFSPSDQLWLSMEQQLSPAFLIGGFLAEIAWLVVGALTARSRY